MTHLKEARLASGARDRVTCSLLWGENGSEFRTILPPFQVSVSARRGNEPYGRSRSFNLSLASLEQLLATATSLERDWGTVIPFPQRARKFNELGRLTGGAAVSRGLQNLRHMLRKRMDASLAMNKNAPSPAVA
jgi:hypothetical protein